MSPHVNNFVTDLVEMAKAMDELPKAQALVKSLQDENFGLLNKVQERELHIIELKAEVETHLASIRSLEVARDDAELRFLELEEHATSSVGLARAAKANLEAMIRQLDPPKPEPVSTIQPAEAEHVAIHSWADDLRHGSSEPTPSDQGSSAGPLSETSWAGTSSASVQEETAGTHTASLSDTAHNPSPGQSEADPTVTGTASPSTDAPNTFAHSTDAVTTAGKYSNKLYEDHPYYVSLAAWIAGGGTEADYNYRRPSMVGSISGDQH